MSGRPTPHKPESYLGRTVAGRYVIKDVLGAGGMGAVFIAEQQPLGREVALKIIKRSLADDPDAVARFEQEARSVSTLSHPNIITIFDFGHDDDGTLFLAMELIHGTSLRELLSESRHLDWSRTLPIASDICRALAEAHRAGIIHRDLKPDNVMLIDKAGEREFAKVLDFGVAKLLEKDGTRLTSTGVLVGTPGYISPEQMNGTMNDARSDLYALGVVWYEMLAGLSPFHDTTPMRLAIKHMTETPPPLKTVVPGYGIPPAIEALVMRLLEKSPDARAESAEALLVEIDALWAQTNALPPSAATETAMSAPMPPPPNALPTPTPVAAAPVAQPPAAQPPVTAPQPTPVTTANPSAPIVAPQPTPQPVQVKSGCSVVFMAILAGVALCIAGLAFLAVFLVLNAPNAPDIEVNDIVEPNPPAPPVVTATPPSPPPRLPLPRVRGAKKDTPPQDALDAFAAEVQSREARKIAKRFVNALDSGSPKRAQKAIQDFERFAAKNPAAADAIEEKLGESLAGYILNPPPEPKARARWQKRVNTLQLLAGQGLLDELGL